MSSSDEPRPSGLIAKEGIELLTLGTPNGVKASILLEELKAAYGLQYTFQHINIGLNIQKEDWFTKVMRRAHFVFLTWRFKNADGDKLSVVWPEWPYPRHNRP
jgi:hypothetical protein